MSGRPLDLDVNGRTAGHRECSVIPEEWSTGVWFPEAHAAALVDVAEAARGYRETQERSLPFETQQAAFVAMSNALTAIDALEGSES